MATRTWPALPSAALVSRRRRLLIGWLPFALRRRRNGGDRSAGVGAPDGGRRRSPRFGGPSVRSGEGAAGTPDGGTDAGGFVSSPGKRFRGWRAHRQGRERLLRVGRRRGARGWPRTGGAPRRRAEAGARVVSTTAESFRHRGNVEGGGARIGSAVSGCCESADRALQLDAHAPSGDRSPGRGYVGARGRRSPSGRCVSSPEEGPRERDDAPRLVRCLVHPTTRGGGSSGSGLVRSAVRQPIGGRTCHPGSGACVFSTRPGETFGSGQKYQG
jgi:hypothetical protein